MASCYAWFSRVLSSASPSSAASNVSATGSPLPKNPHIQLSLDFHVKKRLIIVGDIHGCLDELKRLLEKVKFDPTTTTVISVGDTMVKGPNSVGVIRYIRSFPRGSFFVIRGNHEDNALLARFKPEGKHGQMEVFSFVKEFTNEEIEWLQELPVSISIPELSLLVVHAGVNPTKVGWPVSRQEFSDLIRIRCVDETDGSTTKKNPDEGKRKLWATLYQGPPLVVFGHDAKRKLQIHPWARGLDTGCVYGGSLTAMVVEDTRDTSGWLERAEIVSVPAARAYCQKDDD